MASETNEKGNNENYSNTMSIKAVGKLVNDVRSDQGPTGGKPADENADTENNYDFVLFKNQPGSLTDDTGRQLKQPPKQTPKQPANPAGEAPKQKASAAKAGLDLIQSKLGGNKPAGQRPGYQARRAQPPGRGEGPITMQAIIAAALVLALLFAAVTIFQLNSVSGRLGAAQDAITKLQNDYAGLDKRVAAIAQAPQSPSQSNPSGGANPSALPSQPPESSQASPSALPSPSPGSPESAQNLSTQNSSNANGATYTVVSGDSLTKISARLGCTVQQLLQANKGLTMDSIIHVGDVLNVPG